MWWPPEQQNQLEETVASFPHEFKMRAYPGERFRINAGNSYFSGETLYLYTDILINDRWTAFAKGTPSELRREVIEL